MDMGPFGGARSTNRANSTTVRRESSSVREHNADTPQSQSHSEPSAHRTVAHPTSRKKQPRLRMKWIIVCLSVIVVLLVGWLIWQTTSTNSSGVDASKYQAVFLANGQAYFGRLQVLSGGDMKLTNVFYVQSNQTSANDNTKNDVKSANADNMQLIKLGNEVHGPEDAMIINRQQVLFYENLKSDGKVVKLIEQYRQ